VAKKIRKIAKEPDEFISGVEQLLDFAQKNSKRIIVGAASIVVIIALIYGWRAWSESQEAKAALLFQEAMAVYGAPVITDLQDPSQAGQIPLVFDTDEEKYTSALEEFDWVLSQYPSSKAAKLSRSLRAQCLWQLERKEEAEAAFREIADRYRGEVAGDFARLSIARIREDTGDLDSAISEYNELLNLASGELAGDMLLESLARCYEQNEQPAEALQTYQQIVDQYPASAYSYAARQKVTELRPLVPEIEPLEEEGLMEPAAEGETATPPDTDAPAADADETEPAEDLSPED
jgi:predicted negative regulator of RcsB-dependent stress response